MAERNGASGRSKSSRSRPPDRRAGGYIAGRRPRSATGAPDAEATHEVGGAASAVGDLWSDVKGAVSSRYRSNIFGTSQRSVDRAIEELQSGQEQPSFWARLRARLHR